MHLDLRRVRKSFDQVPAVQEVSFGVEVERGEFFTLLGPSGSGKSTILRLIAGFELPDGGEILLKTRLRAAILNNPAVYPSPQAVARLQEIRDVGRALPLYDRIWTEIKAHR